MNTLEDCASLALPYLIDQLEQNSDDVKLENLIEDIMDILGRYD